MYPKSTFLLLFTCLLMGCSPKVLTDITGSRPALDAYSTQLVFLLNENLPENLEKIGMVKIGDRGFTMGCDFPAVIALAKEEARKMGGNVLKITEHKTPNLVTSSCHRITADVFYLNDIRPYEKEIIWSSNRQLEWADFKGTPQDFPVNAVAVSTTNFEIRPEIELVKFKRYVRTKVLARFVCPSSWVRDEGRTDLILKHEQGHFDITEIFARKMERALNEPHFTVDEFNEQADAIVKQYIKESEDYQRKYDNETYWWGIMQNQPTWTERIENQLKEIKR